MGTKPLKFTRADRRLKENRHLPPYETKDSRIKNSRKPEPTPNDLARLPIDTTIIHRKDNQS